MRSSQAWNWSDGIFSGSVSSSVKLTHPSEVKLIHLG